MTARDVRQALDRLATPAKATSSAWFFKTGPGHYGEGDEFIGVTVPEQRTVARHFRELSLDELAILLASKTHEHRLTALIILVDQFGRAEKRDDRAAAKTIVEFYLHHRARVNNWDLVDSSAAQILGAWLLAGMVDRGNSPKDVLYQFAHSPNLWERRIAMIATYAFIKAGQFEQTLEIAKLLLNDPHDLIHKAVGWMLREVGNRDQQAEERFLEEYAHVMPRTMLRYAIEKFPEDRRRYYLKVKAGGRSPSRQIPEREQERSQS